MDQSCTGSLLIQLSHLSVFVVKMFPKHDFLFVFVNNRSKIILSNDSVEFLSKILADK